MTLGIVNVLPALTAQSPWLVKDLLPGTISLIVLNALVNFFPNGALPVPNPSLALEARGSYPLKAVTGTTTALLAHLAKALWLAKASLQTLTTSFVLNVPRKNLWPIQLSHKIWQKNSYIPT